MTVVAQGSMEMDDRPAATRSDKRDPQRRCLVTRSTQPKTGLIRFVVAPDGGLVADLSERLPGRGLWVSARASVLNEAIARKLFNKAAGQAVHVPAALIDQLADKLRRRCLDCLGLARGAGLIVNGYEKVDAMLRAGRAGVLIQASDGAQDGKRRLSHLAEGLPQVELFQAADLASALGREWVVHLAMRPSALSRQFLRDVRRYAGVIGLERTDNERYERN